ncbi:hypothetical protein L1987_85082 [Smallanthus sonchifolius]|uniref:Uncharacterized protein n=1 Tax=Smallanthus sonchifolius TaxID=185202 RepID=A0ACB8XVF9_9ASTR|nr:hypothetical protein L1987_85082 [Smallanthus sonchifolius]
MWVANRETAIKSNSGIKFGRNFKKGIITNFTSWKSVNDPSQGEFMTYWDFNGLPQIFQKKGDVILHRLGSWNGLAFTGRPKVRTNSIYTVEYVSNDKEIYTKFELINSFVLSKLTLSPEGKVGRFSWINRTQGWFLLSSPTSGSCVQYSLCGPYGSCEIVLDCGVGEGFRKYSFVKLPDTRGSWFDRSMTLEQSYATLDIKYGTGCLIWYRELIDMRIFLDDGQDIYVRMAASESDEEKKVSESKKKVWIIVIPVTLVSAILQLKKTF